MLNYEKVLRVRMKLYNILYKVCVGFAIDPVTINLKINHNFNKILKSDWLSTVLISALIGQCNRRVRIMPW